MYRSGHWQGLTRLSIQSPLTRYHHSHQEKSLSHYREGSGAALWHVSMVQPPPALGVISCASYIDRTRPVHNRILPYTRLTELAGGGG
jgi:hypothetical protein